MRKICVQLALFASFLLCQNTHAQDITLGQSVPLTGSNAEIGRDMRDGALAVFAKANASKALGNRKIQLVTLDNANSRPKALENTKQLIDVEGVDALFGYNSATTSLDALPLLAQNKMAMFAPYTGSPSARDHSNVFTVRGSYLDEAKRVVEVLKNTGLSKAVIVYYDDEAGKSNVQLVTEAFAGAAVRPRSLAVKRNHKLTAAAFDAVFNDQPHYMVFTTQANVVGDYMQAAKAKGVSIPVSALSFVNPDELARSYGEVARGAIVSQVVPQPGGSSQFKNLLVRDCARTLKDFNGAQLDFTSLESCIAAKTIVKVIQKMGPSKVTRQSLLRGLETAGRIDLDGFVLDYTGNHHGSKFADVTFLTKDSMFQSR
jgi:branched-chain amino acid transport system substrate-binding protein